MAIRIQTEPFDPGRETNLFLETSAGAGAAVTFTGLVRSDPKDPVSTLTLECYPELAMNQIGAVEANAIARFGLIRATVVLAGISSAVGPTWIAVGDDDLLRHLVDTGRRTLGLRRKGHPS